MNIILPRVASVFLAFGLVAVSASGADTSTFEGMVRDSKGRPIKGAEIRVAKMDGKMISKNKTDANGHYVTTSLASGSYKVDLFVKSVRKATLADARTTASRPTELNFDFRDAKETSAKRRIWVPETGTNLGRWVELDDPNSGVSPHQIYVLDPEYLQHMQDRTVGSYHTEFNPRGY